MFPCPSENEDKPWLAKGENGGLVGTSTRDIAVISAADGTVQDVAENQMSCDHNISYI